MKKACSKKERVLAFTDIILVAGKGSVGPQGEPGRIGDIGPQGATGSKGPTGSQGIPGTTLLGSITGQLAVCNGSFDFKGTEVFVPGQSFHAVTGSSGSFTLNLVPPGSYDLAYLLGSQFTVAREGASQVQVDAGQVSGLCSVITTDLNTDAHCGSCDTVCGSRTLCMNQSCQSSTLTPRHVQVQTPSAVQALAPPICVA